MTPSVSVSKLLLRELYAIDVEPEVAARMDGALAGSSRRVLELLATESPSMDGFERQARP